MIEHNKDIEKLADKLMEQIKLDTPSTSFTSNILSKLEADNTATSTTYVPLISARVIYVSIIMVFSIVLFTFLTNIIDLTSFLNFSSEGILRNFGFDGILPSFKFSSIIIYSILLFGLLVVMQITSIKKMHNQSLNI